MKKKQEIQKAINDAYTERTAMILSNLKDRWTDEKEYEDFSDYESEMAKILPSYSLTRLKR